MNYWEECIKEAFEDSDIEATKEQIENVISWVEGANENYSLATGQECIPNPLEIENQELKKELQKERDKVVCNECLGRGYTVSYGPCHSSEHTCHKCNGEGRR